MGGVCGCMQAEPEYNPDGTPKQPQTKEQIVNDPKDLRKAARDCDLDAMQPLLERMPVKMINSAASKDEVEPEDVGKTALHFCSGENYLNGCTKLLLFGANMEARDAQGRTPLHLQLGGGMRKVAHLLMKRGANVNAQDKSGATPFQLALRNGHKAAVVWCLEVNAKRIKNSLQGCLDLNLLDKSGTGYALLIASYGWWDVLETLLRQFKPVLVVPGSAEAKLALMNLNTRNKDGETVLGWVLRYCMSAATLSPEEALPLVRRLLSTGVSAVTPSFKEDVPPLCFASAIGSRDLWNLISKAARNEKGDAALTAKDGLDRSQLHYACAHGNLDQIKLLLGLRSSDGKNAELFTAPFTDKHKNTPLHLAAIRGHVTTCAYLLDLLSKYTTSEDPNDDYSPAERILLQPNKDNMAVLHMALKGGPLSASQTVALQCLDRISVPHLQMGAHLMQNLGFGKGLFAAKAAMSDIKQSMGQGGSKSVTGRPPPESTAQNTIQATPLMLAVASHQHSVVKHLLEHFKVDVNEQNYAGETALIQCLTSVTKETASLDASIFKLLIDHGSSVEPEAGNEGNHPLLAISKNDCNEFALLALDILRQHSKKGKLDWGIKDPTTMRTPLMEASLHNNSHIVRTILEAPNCLARMKSCGDRENRSPLMYAAWGGSADAMRLLLNKGANVHVKDLHQNSVMSYCMRIDVPGTLECAALLLRAGAEPDNDATDVNGEGLLHRAVRYGASDFIRLWARYRGFLNKRCTTNPAAQNTPTALKFDVEATKWHAEVVNEDMEAAIDILDANVVPFDPEEAAEDGDTEDRDRRKSGVDMYSSKASTGGVSFQSPQGDSEDLKGSLSERPSMDCRVSPLSDADKGSSFMSLDGDKGKVSFRDSSEGDKGKEPSFKGSSDGDRGKESSFKGSAGGDKDKESSFKSSSDGDKGRESSFKSSSGVSVGEKDTEGMQGTAKSSGRGSSVRGGKVVRGRGRKQAVAESVEYQDELEWDVRVQGQDGELLDGASRLPSFFKGPSLVQQNVWLRQDSGRWWDDFEDLSPVMKCYDGLCGIPPEEEDLSLEAKDGLVTLDGLMLELFDRQQEMRTGDPGPGPIAEGLGESLSQSAKRTVSVGGAKVVPFGAQVGEWADRKRGYSGPEIPQSLDEHTREYALKLAKDLYAQRAEKSKMEEFQLDSYFNPETLYSGAPNYLKADTSLCDEEILGLLDQMYERLDSYNILPCAPLQGADLRERNIRSWIKSLSPEEYPLKVKRWLALPKLVEAAVAEARGRVAPTSYSGARKRTAVFGLPPLPSRPELEKTSALTYAVRLCRPASVKALLDNESESNPAIDLEDLWGHKALDYAMAMLARDKFSIPLQQITDMLLVKRPSINPATSAAHTNVMHPLCLAVITCDLPRVAWMCCCCAAPIDASWIYSQDIPAHYEGTWENMIGNTEAIFAPLHLALLHKRMDIVRLLLDLGADPNAHTWGLSLGIMRNNPYSQRVNFLTDLAKARSKGKLEMVDEAIKNREKKIEINQNRMIKDYEDMKFARRSKLSEMARNGQEWIAKKSEAAGATLLSMQQLLNKIKLFIQDLTLGPDAWVSALHLAARYGLADNCLLLIKRGAAINGGVAACMARRTPLEEALKYARKNFVHDNVGAVRHNWCAIEKRIIERLPPPSAAAQVKQTAMEAKKLAGAVNNPFVLLVKPLILAGKVVINMVLDALKRPIAHYDTALRAAHVLLVCSSLTKPDEAQTNSLLRDMMDNGTWTWIGGQFEVFDDSHWLKRVEDEMSILAEDEECNLTEAATVPDFKDHQKICRAYERKVRHKYMVIGAEAFLGIHLGELEAQADNTLKHIQQIMAEAQERASKHRTNSDGCMVYLKLQAAMYKQTIQQEMISGVCHASVLHERPLFEEPTPVGERVRLAGFDMDDDDNFFGGMGDELRLESSKSFTSIRRAQSTGSSSSWASGRKVANSAIFQVPRFIDEKGDPLGCSSAEASRTLMPWLPSDLRHKLIDKQQCISKEEVAQIQEQARDLCKQRKEELRMYKQVIEGLQQARREREQNPKTAWTEGAKMERPGGGRPEGEVVKEDTTVSTTEMGTNSASAEVGASNAGMAEVGANNAGVAEVGASNAGMVELSASNVGATGNAEDEEEGGGAEDGARSEKLASDGSLGGRASREVKSERASEEFTTTAAGGQASNEVEDEDEETADSEEGDAVSDDGGHVVDNMPSDSDDDEEDNFGNKATTAWEKLPESIETLHQDATMPIPSLLAQSEEFEEMIETLQDILEVAVDNVVG